MTSISIKPGTWVARMPDGRWILFKTEPTDREYQQWTTRGFSRRLDESIFDLTTLPTYHEPDWRQTKFQVQT